MTHLLDTHTIIWFINGDFELSKKARNLIGKDSVTNFVSVASLWEIAIKVSLGKHHTPYLSLSHLIKVESYQEIYSTTSIEKL